MPAIPHHAAPQRAGKQRPGGGFLIERPLRIHGEHNGHKVRVSCLVKNLIGRVAGAGDGRCPCRAEDKSIRVIPDILSSCQAGRGGKKTEGLQYPNATIALRDSCVVTHTHFASALGEKCRPVFFPPVCGSFKWETFGPASTPLDPGGCFASGFLLRSTGELLPLRRHEPEPLDRAVLLCYKM